MNGISKYITAFTLLSMVIFVALVSPVFAADPLSEGIAIDLEIDGKLLPEGSIISLINGKYRLSNIPYDGSVYGIITDHPSILFKDLASAKKRPVITMGKAIVRVSTVNGLIKVGDLITTSAIPGVGQKAKENGYVIGIAGQDYLNKDPNKIGTIYATLHLNYGFVSTDIRDNLVNMLKNGARAPFTSPINTLRYLAAGIIAMLTFAGGFWFFGRVSGHGIEAVGRNPLARRYILLSILFNVVLTVGIMFAGVALAYMILII